MRTDPAERGWCVCYTTQHGPVHGPIHRTRAQAEQAAAESKWPTRIINVRTSWPEATEATTVERQAA